MNLDLDTCLQYKKKCQIVAPLSALISNTNTKISSSLRCAQTIIWLVNEVAAAAVA